MKKLLAPAFALALLGFNAPAFAIGPGPSDNQSEPAGTTLSVPLSDAPVGTEYPDASSQSASSAPVNIFNRNAPQLAPGTWLPVSYTDSRNQPTAYKGLW